MPETDFTTKTSTCIKCGKEFSVFPSSKRKFCSQGCYWENRREENQKLIPIRFWLQVDKNGPVPEHYPELGNCWIWTGPHQNYGLVQVKRRTMGAHKLSWILEFGAVPSGLFVCHKCDVKLCIRPTHLFLGTPQDNSSDAVGKGITARGDKHGMAILKTEEVKTIRELGKSGMKGVELAGIFGVTQGTISSIRLGKSWKHLI